MYAMREESSDGQGVCATGRIAPGAKKLAKTMGSILMGDLSENFSRVEFACRCGACDIDTVDAELIRRLEEIRAKLGGDPLHILSGIRCEAHNRKIGGARRSQHLRGKAADFVSRSVPPAKVAAILREMYPHQYGIGQYETFTHFDVRGPESARWGET